MFSILRGIGIFIILTLIGVSTTSAQREATGEDGSYSISGIQTDGTPYSGALFLTDVIGQEPLMIATGHFETPYRGIGYVLEGVAGIVYGGQQCSLGMYQLTDHGMRGIWSMPTLDGVRAQEASVTDFEEGASILTFNLTSVLGEDKAQFGDLVLEDSGETARVTMTIGGEEYLGTGLVVSDILVVAYGDAACGVSAYDTPAPTVLDGLNTRWGSDVTAQERGEMASLAGDYAVAGTNPDGSAYQGALTITSETYHHTFTWQIGETTYTGVALLRGGVMGVGFGGETCGVTTYNISQAGHLDGDIFFPGYERQGWETAERLDAVVGAYGERIAGSYRVVDRQNPSGERFTDTDITVTITPVSDEGHGALYDVRWDFPDDTFMNGIGIYLYNTLSVGFGGEQCGVVAYEVSGGALRGGWATVGGRALGTEDAQAG